MKLEAGIMNKNTGQTSTRGLILGCFLLGLISCFLIFIIPVKYLCVFFTWRIVTRGKEQRLWNTFKTHHNPTPILTPSSAKLQKNKTQKHSPVIYTAFNHFLGLYFKHTSISQLHIFPTYSVPLNDYPLLFYTSQRSSCAWSTRVQSSRLLQDGAAQFKTQQGFSCDTPACLERLYIDLHSQIHQSMWPNDAQSNSVLHLEFKMDQWAVCMKLTTSWFISLFHIHPLVQRVQILGMFINWHIYIFWTSPAHSGQGAEYSNIEKWQSNGIKLIWASN